MKAALPDPSRASLTSRVAVIDLLERHGLRAERGFGQNFLVDDGALKAIVAAAELTGADSVFEVGPGLGVLTRELAARALTVVSVELDRRLAPALAETLAGLGNVELLFADAMAFDLGVLPPGCVLVANLPYNVATALITKALASGRFGRLVFLVQKEVAQRLAAKASEPAYGALSLLTAHFGRVRLVREVKPGSFLPAPKVTSSVVRIDVDPQAAPDDELFELIHQGFAHRRKTLKRNLIYAGYPEAAAEAALAELGLDQRVRAEALSLAEFKRLRMALAVGLG